jgi:hypothetical protein
MGCIVLMAQVENDIFETVFVEKALHFLLKIRVVIQTDIEGGGALNGFRPIPQAVDDRLFGIDALHQAQIDQCPFAHLAPPGMHRNVGKTIVRNVRSIFKNADNASAQLVRVGFNRFKTESPYDINVTQMRPQLPGSR